MSEERADQVSIDIKKKLDLLSPTPFEPCIFRVDDQLRKQNQSAYEPTVVAIGPYHHGHHGKQNLQEMEHQKLRYLQLLLKRRGELSVDRYVMALRGLEERARNCYAGSITLNEDDFVKTMLLDGCFIIELFRRFRYKDLRDMYLSDPIFQLTRIQNSIRRDLMLVENQLPFFILDQLFNLTKGVKENIKENIILDAALDFLGPISPGSKGVGASNRIKVDDVNHLLALVHKSLCSSFHEIVPEKNVVTWKFIKCTTELREAGIKFKKAEKSTTLWDIKFINGVMEIPPLAIEDDTESFFRNLIAYEQYCLHTPLLPVTDYARFMDCLINSAKDAKELCHCGIVNYSSCDEVVSTLFNELRNNVAISPNFCYLEVFNIVNKHEHEQLWNTWMAMLRRHLNLLRAKLREKYFNSPWYIISVLAAVILLVLALAQTIFSILSYSK